MKSFESPSPRAAKEESGVRPISKKKEVDTYLDELEKKLDDSEVTKITKLPEAMAASAEEEDFDELHDIPGESPAEMWGVKEGDVDEEALPPAEGPKEPRRRAA